MINEAADRKVSKINEVKLHGSTLEVQGNEEEIAGHFESYFGEICD